MLLSPWDLLLYIFLCLMPVLQIMNDLFKNLFQGHIRASNSWRPVAWLCQVKEKEEKVKKDRKPAYSNLSCCKNAIKGCIVELAFSFAIVLVTCKKTLYISLPDTHIVQTIIISEYPQKHDYRLVDPFGNMYGNDVLCCNRFAGQLLVMSSPASGDESRCLSVVR